MAQSGQPTDIATQVDDATFDVAFTGIRAGVPRSEATASLAALFKVTPEQIAGLLDDRSHVVRRGCTPALAAVYKEAIERAGGRCELIECLRPTLLVDASLFQPTSAGQMKNGSTPTAAPETSEIAVAAKRLQSTPHSLCSKCGAALSANSAYCATCGAPQVVHVVAVADERDGGGIGGGAASGIALRPEETILFDGDVVLLKSKVNVSQTHAAITNQRMFVSDGSHIVERGDIESVTEEKHGLDVKMVFRLRDGRSLAMTAANRQMFVAAAKILAGQADMSTMPTEPKLADVKNGTAWLAAFGPLVSGVVMGIVGTIMWGNVSRWGTAQEVMALVMRVGLIYLFLRIDYLKLQGQGYNVTQLGLADPATFPLYLFSRANVFKQGKAPAITWCVLVVIDVLYLLAATSD